MKAIKPGPKRTATSTEKPDQRQRDNKKNSWKYPIIKTIKINNKEIDYTQSYQHLKSYKSLML